MSTTRVPDEQILSIARARATGETLEAIGAEWGVSRERARQLLARAKSMAANGSASPELGAAVRKVERWEAKKRAAVEAKKKRAGQAERRRREREIRDKEIAARYLAGEPTTWIAHDMGLAAHTVAYAVRRSGVEIGHHTRRGRYDNDAILEAVRRGGKDYSEIAEEHGCSAAWVGCVAREAGIVQRTFVNSDDRAAILAAVRAGSPYADIAETFGRDTSTISRIAIEAGIRRQALRRAS